jgi:hypothetical protein
MDEARLVVAGVEICASYGLATASRLGSVSGGHIIIPSSAFFASLAATPEVTRLGCRACDNTLILSVAISRHVEILGSSCFSSFTSLSSIVFETESELTGIKSNAVYCCYSLESIPIPHHVQILGSSCFSFCNSLLSILFGRDSELAPIESKAFSLLPSNRSQFLVMLKFLVHHAFHPANHFHRLYLKRNQN